MAGLFFLYLLAITCIVFKKRAPAFIIGGIALALSAYMLYYHATNDLGIRV